MKIILTERVKTLGNVGEIVNVTAGFARNYLFPKKLAILADESSSKKVQDYQKRLSKKINEEKKLAEGVKAKLEAMTFEFIKKVGASGKIFGTLTTQEIAAELEKKGFNVERKQIVLDDVIKSVGTFEAKAKLFNDVVAKFKVKVSIDAAQAEELKKQLEEAKMLKKLAKEKAEAAAALEAKAQEDAANAEAEAEAPKKEEKAKKETKAKKASK
jgi:large subunit ribosomal protein L9